MGMHMDTKRASTEEIRKAIQELRNTDLSKVDIDDLKKRLTILFHGYTGRTPLLRADIELYRGVLWSEKPQTIKDLSYPPTNKIVYGRVNRPGQPMFYCSLDKEAVFFELRPKLNDTIAIGKWRSKGDLFVFNLGYSSKILNAQGSDREVPSWAVPQKPKELQDENILVRDFFNDEFTKVVDKGNEYLFKLSIAIAEIGIREDKFVGLLYPTIAMRRYSDNLALKPSFVDQNLSLEKVEFFRIDEIGDFEYLVTTLDFATSFGANGEINWKFSKLEEAIKGDDTSIKLSIENDKWTARNTKGEIVGFY